MSKKLLFVFNPFAGKGYIKNRLFRIVDIFVKNEWSVNIYPTQGAEDACRVIAECGAGYDLVVVSGGDGTLNEGIRGIMALNAEERPYVGYIPAGTTNDFASNLGISKNAVKAAEGIMTGNVFKCDIGQFNNKHFIYVAAFGAFTDVAYGTPQQYKNTLGQTAYFLEGIKRLHSLKSYRMKVCYEGAEMEDEFIFGMVSNTNYLGGFKAEKAFKAQLNDGLFEVILIKRPKSLLEMQDLITHLVIQDFKTDSFCVFSTDKISFLSEESVQWTLDGEFGGAFENVNIRTEREAVKLFLG